VITPAAQRQICGIALVRAAACPYICQFHVCFPNNAVVFYRLHLQLADAVGTSLALLVANTLPLLLLQGAVQLRHWRQHSHQHGLHGSPAGEWLLLNLLSCLCVLPLP
jgi:hypothetical protein